MRPSKKLRQGPQHATLEAELFDDVWGSPGVLLQTDGANPTPHKRPAKKWEVEGREPEEGEDSMMGWVTVRGRKECQVEMETEEMKTPEVRRILVPVHNPSQRVEAEVGSVRWWEENFARWWTRSGQEEMTRALVEGGWERRGRYAWQKSKEGKRFVWWSPEEEK